MLFEFELPVTLLNILIYVNINLISESLFGQFWVNIMYVISLLILNV